MKRITTVTILRSIVKENSCEHMDCFGENTLKDNFGIPCPLYLECGKNDSKKIEKAQEKLNSWMGE